MADTHDPSTALLRAPVRIAMWSGPRNISTALMRSFENRPDAAVLDEPFYAAFLAACGADHPMAAETLTAGPTDPAEVERQILAPTPNGERIFYQKHMAHHMLPGFPTGWMSGFKSAFLIRRPEAVLASYAQKRAEVTLADIGAVQLRQLFDAEADRLGHAPPVIEGASILADPRGALTRLCAALDIPFLDEMLSWPAGRRSTDGVWAPVWYAAVEASTGFAPPEDRPEPALPDPLRRIADEARPHYEALARYAL